MPNLLGEDTYKKLDSCISNKMQSNLLRFLRLYKLCLTEPEWKFVNDKHHEVRNFYKLPKIHKSKIIKLTINTQKIEIIDVFGPNYLKLRPIVDSSKCPTELICY